MLIVSVAILCGLIPPAAAADTLGDALESPGLIWATGGDEEWSIDVENAITGSSCAKTGQPIYYSDGSWIETTITGPGTLTFSWKVSSYIDNSDDLTALENIDDGYYDLYSNPLIFSLDSTSQELLPERMSPGRKNPMRLVRVNIPYAGHSMMVVLILPARNAAGLTMSHSIPAVSQNRKPSVRRLMHLN
ncbi:hypothetical protein [Methanogenium cariaci]|uniref:hypothetical protein n=1 Tax=Methanogenium cariaci TaxID=2197 RepID=UPI0012F6A93A|nr:hypothetical protein [Methanogenium cariaci]